MNNYLKEGELIRSGIAWGAEGILLLTCSPETEDDSPHTNIHFIQGESKQSTWVGFNAHTLCRVSMPEVGALLASEDGFFALNGTTMSLGNVFDDLASDSGSSPAGNIRRLNSVAGTGYAVGLRGVAASFAPGSTWRDMSSGLGVECDLFAVDGRAENCLYAAGARGGLWTWEQGKWTDLQSPTNVSLVDICCLSNGEVIAVGHAGVIVRGQDDRWEVLEFSEISEDIWSVREFDSRVFVSTFSEVYEITQDGVEIASSTIDEEYACYSLSSSEKYLWSIGERDVFRFDGISWERLL